MEHVLAKTILITQVVELIAKKYKLSLQEARDNFYKSDIMDLLEDDETGYMENHRYICFVYMRDTLVYQRLMLTIFE